MSVKSIFKVTCICAGVALLSYAVFVAYIYSVEGPQKVGSIAYDGYMRYWSYEHNVDYDRDLRKALSRDTSALHRFLTYNHIHDGMIIEHGIIVHQVIDSLGESYCLPVIETFTDDEKKTMEDFLRCGFEIDPRYDDVFFRPDKENRDAEYDIDFRIKVKYPLIYKLLRLSAIKSGWRNYSVKIE